MNKHKLIELFEELAKEYLRSGSAGDNPDVGLKEIWKTLKEIQEEVNKMPS